MTNEEIVKEIQAGHAELLPELWEAVRHFVAQQAYKAARVEDSLKAKTGLDTYHDFYNTGYLAVYEAAYEFDADKGVLFLTCLGFYLKKHFNRIRAEFSGWSRGTFKTARNITVDSINRQILGEDSEDSIELGDTIADPENQYEDLADKLFIESLHHRLSSLLQCLPREQSEAVQLHYYRNLNYTQIAVLQNTTANEAAQNVRQGLNALRKSGAWRKLADFIDWSPDYYTHIGIETFQNSGTSSVEIVCSQRERERRITEQISKT